MNVWKPHIPLNVSEIEAAGLRTFTEEDTACCYAVQDKVWIEDPDGNAWDVFVVKADAPVMKADASTCCTANAGASTCCAPTGATHAG
ncbi:MAG TPA: hypothetical protein VFG35_07515 [Actinoplanes sp.]|nr:hypothetical protein [Actinoplanes sp.]